MGSATIDAKAIAMMKRLADEAQIYRCQKQFYEFCVYMDPLFFTSNKPHTKEIAEAFQAVSDGIISKLAISLPPRAGKSYITSLWCAWMLGKCNTGSIMRNSYAADLAYTFSYDIRQLVQSEKYLKIFPEIKMRSDRKAIDDWALETSKRGAYFCAGVGGPITGKGCDIAGILDDPIKNIEEAMSETIIEKVWKWYTSTHLSRFETGCPEIHIATRWSRKDPIGMLTNEFSEAYSKDFTTIVIPALDQYGKSFCEAIKTTDEYINMKRITDDFIWEAEFMQNPVEAKGLLFPANELNRFSMKEIEHVTYDGIIGHTDTADEGLDYLCSIVGKRIGDKTFITDVVFTQDEVRITQPIVAQMLIDTQCRHMNVESNNGGKSFALAVQNIIKKKAIDYTNIDTPESLQMASKLKSIYVVWSPTMQNKETRILMNSAYIKQNFYFRNDYEVGSDYDKFMRQLTTHIKLGKNKHDDAADACSGLAEYMRDKFFIQKPKEDLPKNTWYTEDEIDDMLASGKITRWQANEYKKRGHKPWNT